MLVFGTPAVLKIETIGVSGVPESQNHELYYGQMGSEEANFDNKILHGF